MSLLNKLGVGEVEVSGLRVLVRVDYNVPMSSGVIQDPRRILATVPTINLLLSRGAKIVTLLSHLGRPAGEVVSKYSLKPLIPCLSKALGREVIFAEDAVGAESLINSSPEGTVVLCENVRFHAEEEGKNTNEKPIAEFRGELSKLGDVFVLDAFAAAHRAHSSVVGVDLPVRAAGLLMQKELEYFGKALESPARPFLAILGGAKVKDKIQLIHNLLDKVDAMIIGGGMAFTFLKVAGIDIGASLFDDEGAKIVPEILQKAAEKNVTIHLPSDFVLASSFSADADTQVATSAQGIPEGWMGLDCGPQSNVEFAKVISQSGTVVWNGPLGVFEFPAFASGTKSGMDALIAATNNGTVSIIGGGDTASAAEKFGAAELVSHVSTGGGASLELLEGKQLPGVVALTDKSSL